MTDKRLALISVSDKRGIETLSRGLVDFGFEIVSTGGTAKAIHAAGLPVTKMTDYTGAPEALDGRLKSLHSKIFGGILAHNTEDHLAELAGIHAELIELVVVNLNSIERIGSSTSTTIEQFTEKIDIGGHCLMRAAARNFERVTVVSNPDDYETILWHLSHEGAIPKDLRIELAIKAFAHTAAYDAAVFQTLPEYGLDTNN